MTNSDRWWTEYNIRAQAHVERVSPLLTDSPFLIVQDLLALRGFGIHTWRGGYNFNREHGRVTLTLGLENFTNEIAAIEASAQVEFTNKAKGDYFFCTGTLRDDARKRRSFFCRSDDSLVFACSFRRKDVLANTGRRSGRPGCRRPTPALVLLPQCPSLTSSVML